MPMKRPLIQRIRLLLGSLFHIISSIKDRARGFIIEETIEAEIGYVRLRGRPDSYKIVGNKLIIVERKSSKKPRPGVWISDLMQATAYSIILLHKNRDKVKDVELEMHYRDGTHKYKVKPENVHMLLKVIDDIIEIKKHGILPIALRGEKKCSKCPFREICFNIDSHNTIKISDIYETGSWLASEKRIVEK